MYPCQFVLIKFLSLLGFYHIFERLCSSYQLSSLITHSLWWKDRTVKYGRCLHIFWIGCLINLIFISLSFSILPILKRNRSGVPIGSDWVSFLRSVLALDCTHFFFTLDLISQPSLQQLTNVNRSIFLNLLIRTSMYRFFSKYYLFIIIIMLIITTIIIFVQNRLSG